MNKRIILAALLLLFGVFLNAQTVDEAAFFALDNQAQGTARSMATGNAFGALGADAASFMANPAGLGFYRNGEFTFTTQFANTYRSSLLNGSSADDNSIRFQFGNISYVSSRRNVSPNIRFMNWGLAYNKRTSFRANTQINSLNNQSSLVDYYRTVANGFAIPVDNLFDINTLSAAEIPAYMAFQTFLINPVENVENAYSSIVSNGRVRQTEIANYSGGVDDITFGFGGNVRDKVYFGGTLGIPIYRYGAETVYTETDESNAHPEFNTLILSEDVDVSGIGFFAKAGVIVRPTEWLRLGATIHSPDWVTLTVNQSDSLYTQVDIGNEAFEDFGIGVDYEAFSYSLRTAPKLTLSGAGFINRRGFISVDLDLVGYERIRYREGIAGEGNNEAFFDFINEELDNSLENSINLRIGGEFAFLKRFRLMGGYGFYGSPYANKDAFSGTNMLSAGFGARLPKFSFDIALQQAFNSYNYRLYNLGTDSPIANFDNNRTRLSATFGFRF